MKRAETFKSLVPYVPCCHQGKFRGASVQLNAEFLRQSKVFSFVQTVDLNVAVVAQVVPKCVRGLFNLFRHSDS